MIPELFRKQLQLVDSLVEVKDHPTISHCIWIRPSHPMFYEALVEAANKYRSMGISLCVIREVISEIETFPNGWCPTKKNWWNRLLGAIHG